MSSDSQEDGRSWGEDRRQVGCLGHVWQKNPGNLLAGWMSAMRGREGLGWFQVWGAGQQGSMAESASELGGMGQATRLEEKSRVHFGCSRSEMPMNSLHREIKSIYRNKWVCSSEAIRVCRMDSSSSTTGIWIPHGSEKWSVGAGGMGVLEGAEGEREGEREQGQEHGAGREGGRSVRESCPSQMKILHISHCWAYTLRKPELKETRVPQCSSQYCLQ